MEKGKIFLGILVLVGIIAFLGSGTFSLSQPAKQQPPKPAVTITPPKPKDVAIWKITNMVAFDPKTQRTPICFIKSPLMKGLQTLYMDLKSN